MYVFVGCHLRGRVVVPVVRRALFGSLSHRENENCSEHACEECACPGAKRRPGFRVGMRAKQVEPVFFVTFFRVCQCVQHLAVAVFSASGEMAVGRLFHALFSQVPAPPAYLFAGRSVFRRHGDYSGTPTAALSTSVVERGRSGVRNYSSSTSTSTYS